MSSLPTPSSTATCSVCKLPGSLRCSKCLGALYCGQECQKKDWKTHKVHCKAACTERTNFEKIAGTRSIEKLDETIEEYKSLAAAGNASAQYNLAVAYDRGLAVSVDQGKAFKLYMQAAQSGLATAQYNLGIAYKKGRGVSVNMIEAIKWITKAAEAGIAEAQSNLGGTFSSGILGYVDYVESLKWWEMAAEQGHAEALYNLAALYSDGRGVAIDKKRGIKYWKKVDEIDVEKDGKGQYSPVFAQAQFNLGIAFSTGDRGVEVDMEQAFKYWKRAAANGHKEAKSIVKKIGSHPISELRLEKVS